MIVGFSLSSTLANGGRDDMMSFADGVVACTWQGCVHDAAVELQRRRSEPQHVAHVPLREHRRCRHTSRREQR